MRLGPRAATDRDGARAGRTELERHFPPDEARRIDALIEGLSIHRALDTHPPDRASTEDAVARIARD